MPGAAGAARGLGRAIKGASKRYTDFINAPLGESSGIVDAARNPGLHYLGGVGGGELARQYITGQGNAPTPTGAPAPTPPPPEPVPEQQGGQPGGLPLQGIGQQLMQLGGQGLDRAGELAKTGAAEAAQYSGISALLRGAGAIGNRETEGIGSPLGRIASSVLAKGTGAANAIDDTVSEARARETTQGGPVISPISVIGGGASLAVLGTIGKPLKGASRVSIQSQTRTDYSRDFIDPDSAVHAAWGALRNLFNGVKQEKRAMGSVEQFIDDPAFRRIIDRTTGIERRSERGGGRLYTAEGEAIPTEVIDDAMRSVFPLEGVQWNALVKGSGKKRSTRIDVGFQIDPAARRVTISSMAEEGKGIRDQTTGATNQVGIRGLMEIVRKAAKEFPEADILDFMRVGGRVGGARHGKVPLRSALSERPSLWKKVNLEGIRKGKTSREDLFQFEGGGNKPFGAQVRGSNE